MTAVFQRPRLDRQVRFDDFSRAHAIRSYLTSDVRKTTKWEVPRYMPLDQGAEGGCVGFGWSAQLAVGPVINRVDSLYAQRYYADAQRIDQMEGTYFPQGASVLAGAKVAQRRGLIRSYSWAFGIDDVINTLCQKGPVVLGLNWYDGMYNTEPNGVVRVNGPLMGGHCILATGYIHNHPEWGGNWVQWLNSWGRGYGLMGVGYIRTTDLEILLNQQGEACIADEMTPTRFREPTWWDNLKARWKRP